MEIWTQLVSNQTLRFAGKPSTCPQCHHGIDPRLIGAAQRSHDKVTGIREVEMAFQCPLPACQRIFVGRYKGSGPDAAKTLLALLETTPTEPRPQAFADELLAVSGGFARIYTQAAAAETYNLREIAGAGYRKALEFLIKDYCISIDRDKEDEIKAKFLGKVIKEHISDQDIKDCAERATWLGNDETHYVREWTDKDINDLKQLIRLTEYWITSRLMTAKYKAEMSLRNDRS